MAAGTSFALVIEECKNVVIGIGSGEDITVDWFGKGTTSLANNGRNDKK